MELLKTAFSKTLQFKQPAPVPSQYPQYFADRAEEEEFTRLHSDWTKPKVQSRCNGRRPLVVCSCFRSFRF